MREWLTRRNRLGLALVAIGLVTLATQCHAFQPWPESARANRGAVVVDYTQDASLCLAGAASSIAAGGNPLGALLTIGSPECTWTTDAYCHIWEPGNDYMLGHAFRHCSEGEFHDPVFFVDYPVPGVRDAADGRAVETR